MITKDSTIEEVVTKFPQTIKVFQDFGVPAIACGEPIWGKIGENAEKYNVKDVEALLKALNKAAEGPSFFLK